ncbi:PREDICTED: uncharacterized protein LOC104587436 [Nelumbo nucifera]|uniref:Uncharacterized protein n=2 Tax=Nelumbo nucifera TaxID=4432 RepID=A0A823A3Z7_NELNU|nr:PREDICTED: uncharacterized protein LOC104587436 [Nelumbo nucifera]DAD48688.1 TPA_asm: hypothetical protein HUJ06_018625 [Nelumbo nucifera]
MAVPPERRKSSSICNIVRLRRIALLWRKLAGGKRKLPIDVPPGHLAVIVGDAGRRFVIRASYLNHPLFRQLLDQAYEEYGHSHSGPLALPCDEFLFQEILRFLRDGHGQSLSLCSYQAAEKEPGLSPWRDSRPLLHGFQRRSTW